ncbi:MAG: HAD family hydrolase [Nitrososphaerales archaeon]
MNKKRVLALDYDRTLTLDDLQIPDQTKKILMEVRKRNLAILGVASGREVPFLKPVNESVSGAFSFFVAENGSVVYDSESNTQKIFGKEWAERVKEVFSGSGMVRFGEVMGASCVENAEKIRKILASAEIESRIERNRDSVMLLPPGVSKGSGVLSAIARFGARSEIELTSFGDGENDFSLFEFADVRVAVSNAVDQLKEMADVVTSKPGGLGVEEYIRKKFML